MVYLLLQTHERCLDKPGQNPKELNPYWKNGGSGLPSEDKTDTVQSNFEGHSWILRSYKRALEQAKQKNVSFKEIAEKQWGSVEKIYSLLQSAGINPSQPDDSYSSDKKSLLYSRSNYDERNQVRGKHPGTSSMDTSSHFRKSSMGSRTFLRPGDTDLKLDSDDVYHSSKHNWKVNQEGVLIEKPTDKIEKLPEVEANVSVQDKISFSLGEEQVTEAMINAVSAKVIKAELTGNKDKVKLLQLELKELRLRKKRQDSQVNEDFVLDRMEKTVLLTSTDRLGRLMPAKLPSKGACGHGHSAKGKSKKYKRDEDYSLRALIEEERTITADDTYEAIAKMASKFVCSGPDNVIDDVLEMNSKSDPMKESKKMRLKVLTESRKMEQIMDTCKFCINSTRFNKHLMIAMGINTYISVPPYQSLTENHCLILPLEHTACSLQMDENVWSEVKLFQKGITRMFRDNNMDVIFTECYTNPTKKLHMYIDCIPIPKNEGSVAPMYFKKAILESDTEWAQNKKLIDTRQKRLKNSIPLGLPYFFVDFNNEGGFAHVIEDTSLFPHYFGKEVIGGLIDTEPRLWLKPPYESFEQQQAKSLKVIEMWKPYDWTKNLKQ